MELAVESEPVVVYNQRRTDFLGGHLAISRAIFHEPRGIAHATRASRCKQMHNTKLARWRGKARYFPLGYRPHFATPVIKYTRNSWLFNRPTHWRAARVASKSGNRNKLPKMGKGGVGKSVANITGTLFRW
jgi:hypothetical protein